MPQYPKSSCRDSCLLWLCSTDAYACVRHRPRAISAAACGQILPLHIEDASAQLGVHDFVEFTPASDVVLDGAALSSNATLPALSCNC